MSRIMDKQVARLLIKHLQVRTGSRIQRVEAPSRTAQPVSQRPLERSEFDSGSHRVMSPQAVALARRQLERHAFRYPNVVASIEAYPRIVERICQLWGYRELRPYLESLVLVETTRVERQGLEPPAQQELMFLYQLTEDCGELIFAPEEREPRADPSTLYHFDL